MPDPDYAKLAQERFTGTKTYGYDQITAVSQGAIRRQMKLMHKIAEDNSPIRKFYTDPIDPEDDDWTCIKNAVLDASSVELLLHNDAKQTVLFTLNLKSGSFQYLGGKKIRPTEETATIQDWRLVFRVRLNLRILDKENVPQFVRDVLRRTDDYSVHQLFVNFNTAQISNYDELLSHIVLPTDAAKLSFTEHIKLYLKKLTKETGKFHSTIHYLPIIKDHKTYRAPTIAPTSLDFQNLPFVTSESDKETENDDKNMLLYLQMTETNELPKDLLPYPKANWVVPPTGADPKYDGTVCLSKRIFLEGWLLPRLARFNQATTWVLKSITYDSALSPLPFRIDAHLGYSASELPKGGTPWVFNSQRSSASLFYYSYGHNKETTQKKESGPNDAFCQQEHSVWNNLEIPVGLDADGKCVIKMSGRIEVWSWASIPAWCITSATWNSTLTLDAVNHGKLMIKVDFPPPFVKSEGDVAWRELFGSKYDTVIADLKERVDTGVKKLDTIAKNLKTDIEGLFGGEKALWTFIFGGNDDFFIDKVGFNSEGDLLAQLVYQLKD